MTYKCLNCGKETPGFNCTCKKNVAIWDSSARKKKKQSEKIIDFKD